MPRSASPGNAADALRHTQVRDWTPRSTEDEPAIDIEMLPEGLNVRDEMSWLFDSRRAASNARHPVGQKSRSGSGEDRRTADGTAPAPALRAGR